MTFFRVDVRPRRPRFPPLLAAVARAGQSRRFFFFFPFTKRSASPSVIDTSGKCVLRSFPLFSLAIQPPEGKLLFFFSFPPKISAVRRTPPSFSPMLPERTCPRPTGARLSSLLLPPARPDSSSGRRPPTFSSRPSYSPFSPRPSRAKARR